MKAVIDQVFAEVLAYLIEAGYVKLEHYFVDGTKIEAHANKHKVVWAKQKDKYQKRVRMCFRRFHLWGAEKVKTGWGLASIAHNMRKMVA